MSKRARKLIRDDPQTPKAKKTRRIIPEKKDKKGTCIIQ